MAFNGFICAYINFDGPLVHNNLWISYFPKCPVVYIMTISWGLVGPLLSAILLFLDWGVLIIFPWNNLWSSSKLTVSGCLGMAPEIC